MKKLGIIAIGCMVMLAGCQQAEEIEIESEELPMSIEASIGDLRMSRYVSSDDSPNNLSFAVGDEIGLFMEGKDLVKWTKTQSGWSTETPLYWPNKSDDYDFYAYYPYADGASIGSVPMPSLVGQVGTVESLSECDFLVASTKQSYGNNGVVSFTGTSAFKHVSSLVAITIKGDCDLKESLIKEISFSAADIGTATTYSFDEDEVSKTGESSNELVFSSLGDNGTGIQMANENEVLYFILNGGMSLSNITFGIKYTTNGLNYKAQKVGLGAGTLTSGGRYNFNLKISDGELTISGGTIQNWGNGTQMDDIEINNPTVDNNQTYENA